MVKSARGEDRISGLSRLTGQRGDWLVGGADGSLYVISAAAFARSYRIDSVPAR